MNSNISTAELPFEDRVVLALLTRMSIDNPGAEYRENASKALHSARMIAAGIVMPVNDQR